MKNALFFLILFPIYVQANNLNSSLEELPDGLLDPSYYEKFKSAPFFKTEENKASASFESRKPKIPDGFGLAGEQIEKEPEPEEEKKPEHKEITSKEQLSDSVTPQLQETVPQISNDLGNYQTNEPPLYQESIKVDANLVPLTEEQIQVREIVLSHSKKQESIPSEEDEQKVKPRKSSDKREQVRLPSGNWQGSTQVYSK